RRLPVRPLSKAGSLAKPGPPGFLLDENRDCPGFWVENMGTVPVFGRMVAVALIAVAGCAMPLVDRYTLEEARGTPVRIEGSRGPLTYSQSQAILADLKKRSP